MLYSILVTLFVILCILLILLVLIQQTKSSLGLTTFGGGAQTLFGGSGGQDVLQKTTWVLGGLFMLGSLTLSIMRAKQVGNFSYSTTPVATQQQSTSE